MPQNSESAEEKKWKIQSATDTLLRAMEISRDKDLMKGVNQELQKRQGDLSALLQTEALKIKNGRNG